MFSFEGMRLNHCACCFLLVLLLGGAQCGAFSSTSNDGGTATWLAKTRETFKLSDLLYLEARLQAREYQCERLVLDAATGSSLLRFCGEQFQQTLTSSDKKLPSSIERCDWIGSVLAYGDSAEELLTRIRDNGRFEEHDWEADASWTLDYVRMNDIGVTRNKSADNEYTSKSLLSCIAQAIQIPAALNPATATDRLRVIDTGQGLFLTRLMREMKSDPAAVETIKRWNNRPFPYSSAINPNIADILTGIIFGLVNHQLRKQPHKVSLLDPTCGSGTFLMFALDRGATVQGWDTNPVCVQGAQRNLQFMFGSKSERDFKICRHDAGQIMPDTGGIESMQLFDCVIANLPWGENSVLYYDETVRILASLPRSLRHRAPCAFVSKNAELQKYMQRRGYEILGDAHIPPLNFVLPTGKKAKKNDETSKGQSTTCVVTVALAP